MTPHASIDQAGNTGAEDISMGVSLAAAKKQLRARMKQRLSTISSEAVLSQSRYPNLSIQSQLLNDHQARRCSKP